MKPMDDSGLDKIVLMGFMGAGKSTVAAEIGESLAVDWLDTDDLVEEMAGETITEIFDQRGESAFRKIEKKAVKKALNSEVSVISLGGGAPLEEENWRLIQSGGTSFYLEVSPERIEKRLRGGKERPLLEGLTEKERREKIKRLLEKREPRYGKADFIVPAGDRSPSAVAEEILSVLEDESGKTLCASG